MYNKILQNGISIRIKEISNYWLDIRYIAILQSWTGKERSPNRIDKITQTISQTWIGIRYKERHPNNTQRYIVKLNDQTTQRKIAELNKIRQNDHKTEYT